jgi:hypothetical protein
MIRTIIVMERNINKKKPLPKSSLAPILVPVSTLLGLYSAKLSKRKEKVRTSAPRIEIFFPESDI